MWNIDTILTYLNLDLSRLRDVFLYDPQAPMIFSSGLFLWLFAAFVVALVMVITYLEKEKIPYEIITYESPRGELGMDRRVLRAVDSDGLAELVVGGFSTEINEGRVKHD